MDLLDFFRYLSHCAKGRHTAYLYSNIVRVNDGRDFSHAESVCPLFNYGTLKRSLTNKPICSTLGEPLTKTIRN